MYFFKGWASLESVREYRETPNSSLRPMRRNVEVKGSATTSLYESLDSSENDVLVTSTLRVMGVTKITEKYRAASLASYPVWRKKFYIGKYVEIYYCANPDANPIFPSNIVFSRGFPEVGLQLPLSLLVVLISNIFRKLPSSSRAHHL